jgi:hypothetical protein
MKTEKGNRPMRETRDNIVGCGWSYGMPIRVAKLLENHGVQSEAEALRFILKNDCLKYRGMGPKIRQRIFEWLATKGWHN